MHYFNFLVKHCESIFFYPNSKAGILMITLSDQGPIGGHATELLGESYDPKLIYYLNMAIGISLVFWMKFLCSYGGF